MNEFFVNKIRVDIQRRQIHREDGPVTLEPRVAQVLLYLARHQGEVVSHGALLDSVWAGTVVEPGALQRCIAQLRKAFHDDARHQKVIATYPKQGYSLVADISSHEQPETSSSPPGWRYFRPAVAAGVIATLILGIVFLVPGGTLVNQAVDTGNNNFASTEPVSLFANPALMGAIGNPDSIPAYSPDGRYVVYPRYLEDRKAHLWARDLAYGNDFLLTDKAGDYGDLAWSGNGSQLVFVDSTCQIDNCGGEKCTSLKSVTLSQSETNPLLVRNLIDCTPAILLSPEWLGQQDLAYIELDNTQATLVSYNQKSRERNILYQSSELIPYRLSFSRQTHVLTISAINVSGRKELLFLDTNTGTINQNPATVFTPAEEWYPSSGGPL